MSDENHDRIVWSTPYDDVFRTLVVDCRQLIIPLLNEAFGEHYTGNEAIVFGQNEHYLRQQDGQAQKRITDSSFCVIGEETKNYLLECQSTSDNSMLVRIFEYATQIALDEGKLTGNRLKIELPNAAVLFLRSSKATPAEMVIEMLTPGGNIEFQVPCLKVKNYTISDIFQKNLLFLIPFYIFIYESRFREIEENEEKLTHLMEEYASICARLEDALQCGLITEYTRTTIVEMSEKVLEAIAEKYEKLKKGVKLVMGGTVLDYEAKRILNEGRAEGENRLSVLIQKLFSAGRIDDVRKVAEDPNYKTKLMKDFGLA